LENLTLFSRVFALEPTGKWRFATEKPENKKVPKRIENVRLTGQNVRFWVRFVRIFLENVSFNGVKVRLAIEQEGTESLEPQGRSATGFPGRPLGSPSRNHSLNFTEANEGNEETTGFFTRPVRWWCRLTAG
jgi:hypothetical protein